MTRPLSSPAPLLEQSRRAFLDRIAKPAYAVSTSERPMYEAALDDFIAWSHDRAERLQYLDADSDQDVVSFRAIPIGTVFWSAYPKHQEGAKLELLPGSADWLPLEVRRLAVDELHTLSSREQLGEGTTLRISFRALKSAARRDQVKALMVRLLDDVHHPR